MKTEEITSFMQNIKDTRLKDQLLILLNNINLLNNVTEETEENKCDILHDIFSNLDSLHTDFNLNINIKSKVELNIAEEYIFGEEIIHGNIIVPIFKFYSKGLDKS